MSTELNEEALEAAALAVESFLISEQWRIAKNAARATIAAYLAATEDASAARIAEQDAKIASMEKANKQLLALIKWHRDGYREMSGWTSEEAAERTKQYSLDSMSGPTLEQIEDIMQSKGLWSGVVWSSADPLTPQGI